ncbi:hypothetical protein [Nocardia farcinica]|uniref:hypothetical protein n=1 Tax=Nocardia farcinica TaxID=37329 RepID=UPI001E56F930|nr:hypothetical protein [Nocardia farcinica]UEX21170.1 hypothetical protein LMJ57_19410 [Nocardia farcinica]
MSQPLTPAQFIVTVRRCADDTTRTLVIPHDPHRYATADQVAAAIGEMLSADWVVADVVNVVHAAAVAAALDAIAATPVLSDCPGGHRCECHHEATQ